MAAAKKGGGLPAVHKPNLPVDWKAQMQAQARAYKDAEASTGGGQFLSIRNGVMKLDDNPVKDNKFGASVVGYCFENAYYEGDFDPKNPTSPVCFAFGEVKMGEDAASTEARMAPHPDSAKPQSEKCSDCKKNQFGTADKGKGKACKNGRRLALLHEDYIKKPGEIAGSPIVFLKVPPTSIKPFSRHVKTIANVLEAPPFAVITEVSCRPDDDKQVVVEFGMKAEVKNDDALGALFARSQSIYPELAVPYGKDGDEGKSKGGSKGPAKKAPAKKAAKKARF